MDTDDSNVSADNIAHPKESHTQQFISNNGGVQFESDMPYTCGNDYSNGLLSEQAKIALMHSEDRYALSSGHK